MANPFSQDFPVAAQISPQTINAAGSATSAYVSFVDGDEICATAIAGTITGSTVAVSFLQATDSSGANAKALTAGGFASKTFAATDDDTTLELIGGVHSLLDVANSFAYVALKIAVTGGTSAIVCGVVRKGPSSYRS